MNVERLNKVKGYRVMANLTQEEMAQVVGLQRRAYIDKENGTRLFTVAELIAIRDTLNEKGINVSLDDLAE